MLGALTLAVVAVVVPSGVDDPAKFTLSAQGYVSDTVVLVQLDDD
jgi:hypothetical protein